MLNISVFPGDGMWLTMRLYIAIVMDMKRYFLPEEARNLGAREKSVTKVIWSFARHEVI
jgi:hypothetical protein